ncbi:MAG TPA: hypothetical protein PK388_07965 [Kiritimatiellia bacterium]|nr:hypothetical protein [Kiritimatiellia bacterium]
MKKAMLILGLALVASAFVGCEDYDEQPLEFVNSSSFTVVVTSRSIEWTGFVLAPGQSKKMTDIRDVDYTYEPDWLVEEGFASTDRLIVFVNASEAATPETVNVVIQNPE